MSRSFFFSALMCMIHEHKCVPSVDKDVVDEKRKEKLVIYVCEFFFSFPTVFLPFLYASCCAYSTSPAKKREIGSEKAIWWGWKLMWYSIFFVFVHFFRKSSETFKRKHLLSYLAGQFSLLLLKLNIIHIFFGYNSKLSSPPPSIFTLYAYRQQGWKFFKPGIHNSHTSHRYVWKHYLSMSKKYGE